MHRTHLLSGIGALALAGAVAALGPRAVEDDPEPGPVLSEDDRGTWHIRALSPRIIGGYGDNFAYDGSNVRPLKGKAEMKVDPESGQTEMVIELETTTESGAVRFSKDKSFEGTIRIVQKLDTEKMKKARIATDVFLHGDTGREAPVMPKIYNYFATWGPAKVFVNGKEVIPMIGSHCMFTEQSRGADGRIDDGQNRPYNPMRKGDRGFTDSSGLEFHFVMHTTEPDKDNFPPHTGWMHLHFSDIVVLEKPSAAEIPYTQAE